MNDSHLLSGLLSAPQPVHTRGVVLPTDSAPRFVDPVVMASAPWLHSTKDDEVEWGTRTRMLDVKIAPWMADLPPDDPRALAIQARIGAKPIRAYRDVWACVAFRVDVQDARGGFFLLPVVVPIGVADVWPDGSPGEVVRATTFAKAALVPWASLFTFGVQMPRGLHVALLEEIYAHRMPGGGAVDRIGLYLGTEAACNEQMGVWESAFFRADTSQRGPINVGLGVFDRVSTTAEAMGVRARMQPLEMTAAEAVPYAAPLEMNVLPSRAATHNVNDAPRTVTVDSFDAVRKLTPEEAREVNRVAQSFGVLERVAVPDAPERSRSATVIDTGDVRRLPRAHSIDPHPRARRLAPTLAAQVAADWPTVPDPGLLLRAQPQTRKTTDAYGGDYAAIDRPTLIDAPRSARALPWDNRGWTPEDGS